MIVSPKFIWVHVPRTGGTWLRGVLRRCLPAPLLGEVVYPGHASICSVAVQRRSVPVLWMIRNPYEWHVSRFFFWKQHWTQKSGGFSQPRARWSEAEKWWAAHLRTSPTFSQALGAMLEFRPLSWFVQTQVHDESGQAVAEPRRFERLRVDLLEFFEQTLGEGMPAKLGQQLRDSPGENGSRHRAYRYYYTDEDRERVFQVEGKLAERYGYEF